MGGGNEAGFQFQGVWRVEGLGCSADGSGSEFGGIADEDFSKQCNKVAGNLPDLEPHFLNYLWCLSGMTGTDDNNDDGDGDVGHDDG